jgi:uncharacterized membrane protein
MTKNAIIKAWKKLHKFPLFFVTFSAAGLLASTAIVVEKIHLLEDPNAQLSCTINPVYSCQSVILSEQSSALGIPNEIIGVAFFGGVLALGIAMIAGAKYKNWLHFLTWLGLAGSMGMVIWFFYQSVYNINALCIYCSIVWFSTWTLFSGYSWWLLDRDIVKLPKSISFLKMFADKKNVVATWFLLIFTFAFLILNHFWYYYNQFFPF